MVGNAEAILKPGCGMGGRGGASESASRTCGEIYCKTAFTLNVGS